jgi:hypothetical protein
MAESRYSLLHRAERAQPFGVILPPKECARIDASGASALTFSRLGDIDPNTTQVIFRVATTISSTVANRMLEDPDEFTAVFSTASGPTAVGQPRFAAPPEPDATATPAQPLSVDT